MALARNPKADGIERHEAEIVPLPWVARRKHRRVDEATAAQARDPDDYPVSTRTLILVGAFVAAFVVIGVWLLETMRGNALIEECLMAGRKNCVPISLPAPER